MGREERDPGPDRPTPLAHSDGVVLLVEVCQLGQHLLC